MKEYRFEIIKNPKTIIIVLVYVLIGFTFITLIAYYTQNRNLTLFFFFLFIFSFFFYKKVVPIEEYVVEMDQSGIVINKNTYLKWTELIWFYHYSQGGTIAEVIEIKSKDGSKVRLDFYKKTSLSNNWNEFKNDFFRILIENNIQIRNYYKSKIWTVILWLIILSWIGIPILLYSLNGDFLKKATMYIVYFSSTMLLVIAIISNRRIVNKTK
ncbi:MAG: hypothetical protein A2W99_12250 [Bacteroidetes bacterium GWF2_33_16]|nr:MAG: hypothetical protein A2X00_02025 [Bacteroidetes bacterium GWE2_32_14]OFY06466.1 MAG: hypothetical protein A2W99_12250 [Bacteroidetes bacterium GWF2_33_16]